jgi:hypothetical protein
MFAHYNHSQYVIRTRLRQCSLTHWLNPSLYPNGKYPVNREVRFAADDAFASSFARCEASIGCWPRGRMSSDEAELVEADMVE